MFVKTRPSVFCLSLLVGIFIASPWSRHTPLNCAISSVFVHAGQKDGESSKRTDNLLKSDTTTVCIGVPEDGKEIIADLRPRRQVPPSGSKPLYELDRKQAVLALIHYPWENLGFDIVFKGSRTGYRAMTLTAKHRIEIYARPGDGLVQQAYDLAHELGHAFDLKNNNEERRRKWCELRGIEQSTPWFGCDACPDYGTPAGDFAETFAFLLLGPGNFHSAIAPLPTVDQIPELAAFCQIEHLSESLNAHTAKKERAAGVPEEVSLTEPVNRIFR